MIFRCPQCARYTMHATCPECRVAAKNPLPPKYSPEDPYGAYRRKLRRLTAGAPKGA